MRESLYDLITTWVSLTDAIYEEELTSKVVGWGGESSYVDVLTQERDEIEARLSPELIEEARKTWRKMRTAHTIDSYSIDYEDAQRSYMLWIEHLKIKLGEKTAPEPVVISDDPGDDLPF